MKAYRLIIFDVDGTLVETKSGATFRKTADDWQWLPGRLEKLQELKAQGVKLAIATNQGGVAFGYLRRFDILKELWNMVDQVGKMGEDIYVSACFTHPKATIEDFRVENDQRRKPGGVMLGEAMQFFGIIETNTLMVGDRPEDEQAAENAGVGFIVASEFFKDVPA